MRQAYMTLRKFAKWLSISLVLAIIIPLGYIYIEIYLVLQNGLYGCEDDTLSQHPSPSMHMTIVVAERGCGATTDNHTVVYLREANEEEPAERQYIFGTAEESRLDARWDNDTRIILRIEKSAEIIEKHETWNEITIIYEPYF